jgi:hypothetical protein
VRSELTIDPYFLKLADAMATWIQCWEALNPTPTATLTPDPTPAPAAGAPAPEVEAAT